MSTSLPATNIAHMTNPSPPAAATTRVTLQGLTKHYQTSVAVDQLDLELPPGKITALLGPSGCGKTTTLKMIAGLLAPSAGEIAFDGVAVTHVPAEQRGAVMVFQNPLLFPHLSVAENVAFGLQLRGEKRAVWEPKVSKWLARVQLAGFEARRPRQLSGGQAQRVALARALIVEPRLLLLDEPLSNLDVHLRDEMRELILELQRERNITTVIVTHDQTEAVLMADRIALMLAGELQQVGEPRAFYERPASMGVARFFGGGNFLAGQRCGDVVETAWGSFRIDRATQPDGPVTLTIRPENLQLCESSARPHENTVTGVITHATYAGTHTRLKVCLAPHSEEGKPPATDASDYTVEVTVAAGARFKPNGVVNLHFPADRLWLLPPEIGDDA